MPPKLSLTGSRIPKKIRIQPITTSEAAVTLNVHRHQRVEAASSSLGLYSLPKDTYNSVFAENSGQIEHELPGNVYAQFYEDEPVPRSQADEEPEFEEPEELVNAWEPRKQRLLHLLLEQEAPKLGDVGSLCHRCRELAGEYRCEDCHAYGLFCRNCLGSSHCQLPCHRIKHWFGGSFQRIELADLQFVHQLGHPSGEHCVRPGPRQSTTVLDITGTHRVVFQYCRCANIDANHGFQLFEHGFYPSAWKSPRTAFTFRLLKSWQLHNFEARTSIWDFYDAIVRMSNNVTPPKEFKNCYKQFVTAIKEWRILRMLKRGGIVDTTAPQPPGNLSVKCVSCPRPGVNLPEDWETQPARALLYAIFLSIDGNFRLSRKLKGDGESSNPSLIGDSLFYAPHEDCKRYLDTIGASRDEEKSATCRGIKAGDNSRSGRYYKKSVSGLVSVTCARHGVFMPSGTVDLNKGEKFANVDFALTSALKQTVGLKRVIVSYDIACKYNLHFLERITDSDYVLMNLVEIPDEIQWLVPKFHLASHIDGCADNYGFNSTRNVGRTCGEQIETQWSALNPLGPSTSEMGFGARRDTLGDNMNDWNWGKSIREATRLRKAYFSAYGKYTEKQCRLEELEKSLDLSWLVEFKVAAKDGGVAHRPRTVTTPSKCAILKGIESAEHAASEKPSSPTDSASGHNGLLSAAVFISMGLDLEMAQSNLSAKILQYGNSPTPKQYEEILLGRQKLRQRISAWTNMLLAHAPIISDELTAADDHSLTCPEDYTLRLPSTFPTDKHPGMGLVTLADLELQLRIGQAHDALHHLRDMLGLKSFLVRQKYLWARGQREITRADTTLARSQRLVEKWALVYRQNRTALLALDETTSRGPLQELKADHLIVLSKWLDEQRFGGDHSDLPWFWRLAIPENAEGGMSVEAVQDWSKEVIRVEWTLTKARRDRWREELLLIPEELRRVAASFRYEERVWESRVLANSHNQRECSQLEVGISSHATRKKVQFATLAANAELCLGQLKKHHTIDVALFDVLL